MITTILFKKKSSVSLSKEVFALSFCAQNSLFLLKFFDSKLSSTLFSFSLTNLELQSYTLFYRVFVREKGFSKKSLWSFDHQDIIVFVATLPLN